MFFKRYFQLGRFLFFLGMSIVLLCLALWYANAVSSFTQGVVLVTIPLLYHALSAIVGVFILFIGCFLYMSACLGESARCWESCY